MAVKGTNVIKLPQTINLATRQPMEARRKRRVAGYARVSTDSDEQFTSYEAQIDYYTQFIKTRSDWQFVKVYTDEGISGLNTKRREGFNSMIQDAMEGKIDLIVTKSVSRFARNTVDSLTTIRALKERGTEVYFEKENIWTFDSKGELLITIMSSLAQEESRSISENVTWGQRKRFADGKVSLPYKQFLGYERGPDGRPKIVPEQAELVRRIYDMFLAGMTAYSIAKQLTQEGISTPAGKTKWSPSTIKSILTNEKYKGDALLQKRFTVDFISKKMKVNEGEVDQYYVENSHEAIISPQLFDRVQAEFKRREELSSRYSDSGLFASRLICGECGGSFGRKVWNSTDKYRRTIWRCNNKYENGTRCVTPHFSDEELQAAFMRSFNIIFPHRESIIEDCRAMQAMLCATEELDAEIITTEKEMELVHELAQRCVYENASVALDAKEHNSRYSEIVQRYNNLQSEHQRLTEKKEARLKKAERIGGFVFELSERSQPLEHFDPRLWLETIDRAIVNRDGSITFEFLGGAQATTNP